MTLFDVILPLKTGAFGACFFMGLLFVKIFRILEFLTEASQMFHISNQESHHEYTPYAY
jgi:hypothetical protein